MAPRTDCAAWTNHAGFAMKRKDEILAQIHRLIDEQLKLLRNTMTHDRPVAFIERKKTIETLLDELKKNGLAQE